jgi:hypothetical protein
LPAAPAAPAPTPGAVAVPDSELQPFSRFSITDEPACPGCAACAGGCDRYPANPYRVWGSAEYILWRIKDTGVPSLSTQNGAGFLFVPVTNTFISLQPVGVQNITQTVTLPSSFSTSTTPPGTGNIGFGDQPGLRFTLGYWLDSDETIGIDANFYRLWRRTNNFFNSSFSPTQGVATGFSDQQLIQTTQIIAGVAVTQTQAALTVPVFVAATEQNNLLGTISSQSWGMDYNGRCRVCSFGCFNLDALGGFRYLDVDERLSTSQNLSLSAVPGATSMAPAGSQNALNNAITLPQTAQFAGTITDLIDTHNRFYGAQFGFSWDWRVIGKVFCSGFTKVALGDMRQTFSLRGFTQQVVFDASRPNNPGIQTTPGGEFVGPQDNNTERHYDRVCLLPEVNFNVGYEITDNLRVFVGYDYMYISALSRPVEQLTVARSTTALAFGGAGSAFSGGSSTINVLAPAFKIHDSQAWIYGISMGVDLRY